MSLSLLYSVKENDYSFYLLIAYIRHTKYNVLIKVEKSVNKKRKMDFFL